MKSSRLLVGVSALLLLSSVFAQQPAEIEGSMPAEPTSAAEDESSQTDGDAAGTSAAASNEATVVPAEPYAETISVAPDEPSGKSAESPAQSSSRLIEEIVVTAQRREENLRDVPISVAAFSSEKLEAAGVENTNDLQYVTPGLTISGTAGYTLIYLRGIGTESFISSFDPSVATYVDGVYVPAQQGALTDLGGVERVEIMKGPQGTLFGRNSTGGAINVITKFPSNEPELSVGLETGNYGNRKAKVYASYPLGDSLGVSVAGIYSKQASYYDVVGSGGQPAPNYELLDDKTRGGRTKLQWTPTDSLEFTLTGYRILQEGSTGVLEVNRDPSPLGTLIGIRGDDADYETSANTPPTLRVDTTGYTGAGLWALPWFDTKIQYSDQSIVTEDLIYDFDGSSNNYVTFSTPKAPNDLQTVEWQFLSNEEGWTPEWLTWVGGFFYLHAEAGYDPFIANIAGTGIPNSSSPLASLLPQAAIDMLNSGSLPRTTSVLQGTGLQVNVNGILETHSYSGFLQTTVNFTDWLALTLGGRYQKEDRFLIKQSVSYPTADGSGITVIQFDQPKVKDTNFSPKATMSLSLTDGTLIYTTYARGFKSGSYNVVSLYEAPAYVKPETVTAYELGIKTDAFDNTLQLNAAIFTAKIEDLQTIKVSLLSGGAVSVENAGAARSRGAEFDALWVPFSQANPGFVVLGSATYLDAKYTSYPNASGFDEDTGIVFEDGDFSGNRITRTPKTTATLGLNQTIDARNGTFELGADVYYNSGFFFTGQNSPKAEQDSYSLINARIGYLYTPWDVRLTAFGSNLADKEYLSSSITVDFGTQQTLAPPRMYGLRLDYNF